jgi:Holliday junction DNA helicase RuvA
VISSLTGALKSLRNGALVIEVGGVGLLVNVPARLASGLMIGSTISLQTVLVVREDALTLYGFESSADREIFELLQTVTGIGPKVAQSALSVYETPEIVSAIVNERSEVLERIPGLGKKGAQRVVLELREKVEAFESSASPLQSPWRDQLMSALMGLGFTARDSQERIEQLSGQFKDLSHEPIAELLRAALSGGLAR